MSRAGLYLAGLALAVYTEKLREEKIKAGTLQGDFPAWPGIDRDPKKKDPEKTSCYQAVISIVLKARATMNPIRKAGVHVRGDAPVHCMLSALACAVVTSATSLMRH